MTANVLWFRELGLDDARSVPGQELVAYHAAPGSPAADALLVLRSIVATRRTRGPAHVEG